MVALDDRESALLRILCEADLARPGELFVVVWLIGGTVIKHPGMGGAEVDSAALLGLDGGGYLLNNTRDGSRPKSFYLDSRAKDELAEAETLAAAESAAGAFVRTDLSFADALDRMIEAEKAQPGHGFTVYRMSDGPMIGHEAIEKPGIFVSHATLSRLVESGVMSPANMALATST